MAKGLSNFMRKQGRLIEVETPGPSQEYYWNKKLFQYYKEVTGESPPDKPSARIKYPRLIRQKFEKIGFVRKAIDWAWHLKNKQGEYYWRGLGKLTLENLYYKVLPAFKEKQVCQENKKALNKMKGELFGTSVRDKERTRIQEVTSREIRKWRN